MRVLMQLIGEFRSWGSVALLVFPAHRKLRQVRSELAEVRRVAILQAVEQPVVAENQRLRGDIATAADILVSALEDPATQDALAPEALRLVR